MATVRARDFRRARDDKPRERSFLHWLARTYIPCWEMDEQDLIERSTGHVLRESPDRDVNDARTNRGDMTFRL